MRQAALPPDREHRFGHGKAEPLAALGQAAFLLGSALFLIAEAVRRLISPEPVENTEVGIAVMLFSLIVTIGLVAYQRHVVRRTGSLAINADALHYSSDVLMNFERHRDAADRNPRLRCRLSTRCSAARSAPRSSTAPPGSPASR